MATLTRADGVVFTIFTYRELITAKKSKLLKNELMLLSRDNGEYARFYDKPGGDFEAAFGHEPGYLLGENVWHYFQQPDDLIYCEQLSDNENAILVVVREGNVFIDGKFPLANLIDEFLGLMTSENPFDIYVYGEAIPLAKEPQEDKFAFDSHLVKSYHELEQAIFTILPVEENFRLIPIAKAISELGLSEKIGVKWVIAFIVLLVLAFGIYKTLQQPEPLAEAPTPSAPTEKPVDPYAGYRAALNSPNPVIVIDNVWGTMQQLFTVPGWTPVSFKLGSGLRSASINLNNNGGNAETLLAWARQNQFNVSITGKQATLNTSYKLRSRGEPSQIYQLKDTSALLYDELSRILPAGDVSMGQATSLGPYGSQTLSLTMQDIGETELNLIAQSLDNFPVQLNSLSLNIANGAISGNIQLTVYGVD